MVDRDKIKKLPEYKKVLSFGFRDATGKIQKKKGAFTFRPISGDPELDTYTGTEGSWTGTELRIYAITSTGKVRFIKGPGGKVIGNVDHDDIKSYKVGLNAIINNIEEFNKKIARREEIQSIKEKFITDSLAKPLIDKQKVYRRYLMIRAFRVPFLEDSLKWFKDSMLKDVAKLKNEVDLNDELRSVIHTDIKEFKRLSK